MIQPGRQYEPFGSMRGQAPANGHAEHLGAERLHKT